MGSNTSENTWRTLLIIWQTITESHLVRVPVSSIDATVLVIKLHSTGDGLGQGEPAGGSHGPAQFVPERFGHILGHQGMLGLDLGKWIRHFVQVCCINVWGVTDTSSVCRVVRGKVVSPLIVLLSLSPFFMSGLDVTPCPARAAALRNSLTTFQAFLSFQENSV